MLCLAHLNLTNKYHKEQALGLTGSEPNSIFSLSEFQESLYYLGDLDLDKTRSLEWWFELEHLAYVYACKHFIGGVIWVGFRSSSILKEVCQLMRV